MRKNILVTGATGFIGSHLVRALAGKGDWIRCLVRRGSDLKSLKGLGVDFVYGDLLDKPSLQSAIAKVDIIYHLAAKVRPDRLISPNLSREKGIFRINTEGTRNLVDAYLNSGIKKFIYFSSVAAAGPGVNLSEKDASDPVTDYGKSKLDAENYLFGLLRKQNFPVLVIRPGLVYGPGNMVLLPLFRSAKNGFALAVCGGRNIMPVCYVGNLIEAAISLETAGIVGETYFIRDRNCSLRDFICAIARHFKKNVRFLDIPRNIAYRFIVLKDKIEQITNLRIYPLNIDISRGTFGQIFSNWSVVDAKMRGCVSGDKSMIDFNEGIVLSIKWYRENRLL